MSKKRRATLAQRKKKLEDAILGGFYETLQDAKPSEKVDLAELAVDLSLSILAKAKNMDADNAVILFPDEPLSKLLRTMSSHAHESNVDFDDVVNMLLYKMHGVQTNAPVELTN